METTTARLPSVSKAAASFIAEVVFPDAEGPETRMIFFSKAAKSVSASLEEKSDFAVNDCLCAVRVYERYSFSGGNRLSLSVTLLQAEGIIYLSAITAGGSTAMIFKLNTMGEEAFLNALRPIMSKYGEKLAD